MQKKKYIYEKKIYSNQLPNGNAKVDAVSGWGLDKLAVLRKTFENVLWLAKSAFSCLANGKRTTTTTKLHIKLMQNVDKNYKNKLNK